MQIRFPLCLPYTVGPKVENKNMLKHYENILICCYENCLQNVLDYKIKSIAFCCISTGIYKYDNRDAAHVALKTVRLWLEKNHSSIDQIIFCTYLNTDFMIYEEIMAEYFPESTVDKINDNMYKIPGNVSTIMSNNSNETPVKGRQNQTESFEGTSNEQNITKAEFMDFNIDLDGRDQNIPLGLLNKTENVCFLPLGLCRPEGVLLSYMSAKTCKNT